MKKVLILGAKGMLGQELAGSFNNGDYEVIAWDKDELDITDEAQTKEKISTLAPAVILNAVAYNAVDKCEEDEKEFELAKKINGEAPGYLAKIAKEIGAVFVHYSSDYVFGAEMPNIPEPEGCTGSCGSCGLHAGFEPEIGYRENDKPAPVNKYGESKLMGEEEVKKNGEKFYIIRLSKLFGKPSLSEEGKRSFFDMMLEMGKKNKEVKAVDEETSCFTYAPDLAQKTKEIIEAKKEFGIYHVINSECCTWYEAAEELFMQAKMEDVIVEPVTGDEFHRPAKRPYFSALLNKKLNPLRSYRDALAEYLKNQK
ncbi:MAG: dTDP 4-dehydrorhamnose reductase [Candidatus Moranbacteria bacterium GW2011_GWF1_34_10]|nr:MAG: dTDP 4-dehydrorhamnose reductase [Candidatus Moranbacteria bacterium GW2011_GWF1_34_10]